MKPLKFKKLKKDKEAPEKEEIPKFLTKTSKSQEPLFKVRFIFKK